MFADSDSPDENCIQVPDYTLWTAVTDRIHVAPPSGQHVNVSNTSVHEQTPAELQTFPSASAALCVY